MPDLILEVREKKQTFAKVEGGIVDFFLLPPSRASVYQSIYGDHECRANLGWVHILHLLGLAQHVAAIFHCFFYHSYLFFPRSGLSPFFSFSIQKVLDFLKGYNSVFILPSGPPARPETLNKRGH